ncbi:MAG: hypothetical protein J2P39_09120 [Candidatus Dormibacteraeota bacterium]|nr:hypothetical protein [Candidatus Dormibacteraeota bacterium]
MTEADRNFRDAVALSKRADPMPTLRQLATNTGLEVEDVVHYALVRYAAAGAEALLALEPQAVRELIDARKEGNWERVGGLIDWLEAGLESPNWRR